MPAKEGVDPTVCVDINKGTCVILLVGLRPLSLSHNYMVERDKAIERCVRV